MVCTCMGDHMSPELRLAKIWAPAEPSETQLLRKLSRESTCFDTIVPCPGEISIALLQSILNVSNCSRYTIRRVRHTPLNRF